jgi:hypothetical protein
VEQQISSVSKCAEGVAAATRAKRSLSFLGVMREFNSDTLAFITRCRDFGDVVRMRFSTSTRIFSTTR